MLIGNRLAVTTESEDLPVPGVPAPSSVATPTPANTRIADLLMARLMAVGSTLTQAQALALLPNLLPPEVLAGLKMDLNHSYGNGRDYDAAAGDQPATAGVVDAAGAAERAEASAAGQQPDGHACPFR